MPLPLGVMLHVSRLAATAVLLGLSIAADLAPLAGGAQGWPMPDLLLCAVACVVGRRPRMMPAPLVLAAGLVRDLLSGAPVGPAAAALLIGATYLRDRAATPGSPGFAMEWLRFAAVAAGTLVLPSVLLWATFAGVPEATALGLRWAATVAAYPVVVALLRVGGAAHRRRVAPEARRA
jgi:rod shape-determining protein MreD